MDQTTGTEPLRCPRCGRVIVLAVFQWIHQETQDTRCEDLIG
jgi:ribosomal protein S27AE